MLKAGDFILRFFYLLTKIIGNVTFAYIFTFNVSFNNYYCL